MSKPWGKICIATRLEKMVENQFFVVWSNLIKQGMRQDDAFVIAKDRIPHIAANDCVRAFLKSDCDTIFFIDSDADVGPTYLEEMREIEELWDYDIMQGFYTRRGWPPEAIWFKKTELGDYMQCIVWRDNFTEPTAMVGLHNTLIRREVFTKLMESRPDVPLADFTWFYYPKDRWTSEDSTFSLDAGDLGFKIGSTTTMKAGHISRVTTGWDTYHEALELSGGADLWRRYYDLVDRVARFTGESFDLVIAKALKGWTYTGHAYERYDPRTPAEHRAFFGQADNGYLYDLLAWNVSPGYQNMIAPLKELEGQRVLVVGGGLGGEVENLRGRNRVDVFEIPGVLRDFMDARFKDDETVWVIPTGESLLDVRGEYDLIVAVDVLEHIHPDEFKPTMDKMLALLASGGRFFFHNNFKEAETKPLAFDMSSQFETWRLINGISEPEGSYGFYERIAENETVLAG